jgi:NAD(P)H-hydrate epimerase
LLACQPEELSGDAATNYRMFQACGGSVFFAIEPAMQSATLIVDALLGTGLKGPARGLALDWIREINSGFPGARVVAVDVPSGMPSDTGMPSGECARADATVTFTAPRYCHVLAPNCNSLGEFRVYPIGSPAQLYDEDRAIDLAVIEPELLRNFLGPRKTDGNKGSYGHVLIVAGSRGKTGAAAMAGMSALRAGAGLVTVASAASAIPVIASYAVELMTVPLPETEDGAIAGAALHEITQLMEKLTVLAIGPGLWTGEQTAGVVRALFATCDKPIVADADALNILAAGAWPDSGGKLRVLTPHPGEMARLTGLSVAKVQEDRIGCARKFACERGVVLVLKGERTLLAFPDGQVWVNPTGSPSMATGGTGDILTGLIAGMLAQFPKNPHEAVAIAVYLHGRAGELGAIEIGEQVFVATDLLRMMPQAMREVRG